MKTRRQREREWRRKSVEMQNELNKDHWNRLGWYKSIDGAIHFDLMVYRNLGDGLIVKWEA